MNETKMRTIDHEVPETKKKSLTPTVIGAIACAFLLFWAVDHIAGGCTSPSEALTFCPMVKLPVPVIPPR